MDTLGQAFKDYGLTKKGYRLKVVRQAAQHHRDSCKLYSSVDDAAEIIQSMSPQEWVDLSHTLSRGGDRRSMYKHGKTKQLRVPEVFHDEIIKIAHWIDRNPERLDELMTIITDH